jgi:ribosomal protein L30/L7E
MKCPDCQNELQILELREIKIHECLSCKGMWLNHGVVENVKDFLALLKILKIRMAVEHPCLEQVWESIESVSPFK